MQPLDDCELRSSNNCCTNVSIQFFYQQKNFFINNQTRIVIFITMLSIGLTNACCGTSCCVNAVIIVSSHLAANGSWRRRCHSLNRWPPIANDIGEVGEVAGRRTKRTPQDFGWDHKCASLQISCRREGLRDRIIERSGEKLGTEIGGVKSFYSRMIIIRLYS